MGKVKEKAEEEIKEPSLEENFAQIEDIISQMEGTDITLEESFELYKSGIQKLQSCNTMLDEVEKKMQILNDKGELESWISNGN